MYMFHEIKRKNNVLCVINLSYKKWLQGVKLSLYSVAVSNMEIIQCQSKDDAISVISVSSCRNILSTL